MVVVRTQPHRETQATRQLDNQKFRVFVPRILKSRRHARKFETIRAPLFPRYIFIALDLGRDRWRSVNGTLGVDRLLTRGGEPEPVPVAWWSNSLRMRKRTAWCGLARHLRSATAFA